MRILAHVFSILAFGLSSLLTVQLLTSRAQGWLAIVMMALLGLIAEGGKGLLFYHGISRAKERRIISAVSSLAISLFLIFLSVLGTVSALNLTENKAREAEAKINPSAQTARGMLSRATELRAEAEELPDIYRTGKIRRRNEAWALEQKAREMMQAEQARPADQFERIGAFLGISPLSAQMLIFWGYGFALEAIACLLAIMAILPAQSKKREILKKDVTPKEPIQTRTTPAASGAQKDILKSYIEQAHLGNRMLGFNKTTLSRGEWENCVKILYKAGLLRKNNVGLAPTKSKEEMLAWVG